MMMAFSRFLHPFQLMFPVFLEVPHGYLNRIPLFFKPLSLWSRIFLSRNFSDHRSRLLMVVSVILSRFLFSSLVWYVLLLFPLFTFSCSGFRGSLMVIICLLFLTFFVTPQTRGSVDYPSTRGIQVEVGLPDATFRKSGRVSFVRGALPNYKTCIYMSQTIQYMQYISQYE